MRLSLIHLERSWNFDLIREIVTNPRIYPYWASDYHPKAADFRPNESEAMHWLLAKDGDEILGLCLAYQIFSPLTWQIEHAILPSAWNRTHEIGAAFEHWLFTETPCQTAVGFTPSCNKLACRYAIRRGLKASGVIPNGYKKNDKLYTLIIYTKQKPQLML